MRIRTVLLAVLPLVLATTPAQAYDVPDGDCEVDAILVNSCRPWLGARASDYPDAGAGIRAQHEHHEQRIGRKLDIAHTFAAVGKLPLANADERYLAQREGTYMFQDWKPAAKWKDAGGGNADVNKHIDAAADRIKEIAPKKLFLTVHHEPENDVSSDGTCTTKGSAGTAAEYVQMWHNVRKRFDARGADNVVWVVDYMNYEAWDCLVPKLYPGDEYVDWVMFNGYGHGSTPDFGANVKHFYDLLTRLSGPGRDLLSKPWGIVEWGISSSTQAQARSYYDKAAATLDEDRFPKLKAYMIFDSPGTHDDSGLRVGYDDKGGKDAAEQQRYTAFANHPLLSQAGSRRTR